MHILLTRPEEDAQAVRVSLEAAGHRVSIAPLLRIEFLPIAAKTLAGKTALIATSRNALRALEASGHLPAALNLPIYTVGPATAALAKVLGFGDVIEGPGTGRELAQLIEKQVNPLHDHFLHLAGEKVAFDLTSELNTSGVYIEKACVYRSLPALALPSEVSGQLSAGEIDAVILMSPATAETWSQIVNTLPADSSMRRAAAQLYQLCISKAAADRLVHIGSTKTLIAMTPNWEEMLALIHRLAAKSG